MQRESCHGKEAARPADPFDVIGRRPPSSLPDSSGGVRPSQQRRGADPLPDVEESQHLHRPLIQWVWNYFALDRPSQGRRGDPIGAPEGLEAEAGRGLVEAEATADRAGSQKGGGADAVIRTGLSPLYFQHEVSMGLSWLIDVETCVSLSKVALDETTP